MAPIGRPKSANPRIFCAYRLAPATVTAIKAEAKKLGIPEARVIDRWAELASTEVFLVKSPPPTLTEEQVAKIKNFGTAIILENAIEVVPRKALDAAGSHPEMPSTNVAEIQTALRANNLAVQRSGSNPYTRERQTRRAKK